MKIDYLRLANVRTDPITHPDGPSPHVHSFSALRGSPPPRTRAPAERGGQHGQRRGEQESVLAPDDLPVRQRAVRDPGHVLLQHVLHLADGRHHGLPRRPQDDRRRRGLRGGAAGGRLLEPRALPRRQLRPVERLLPGDELRRARAVDADAGRAGTTPGVRHGPLRDTTTTDIWPTGPERHAGRLPQIAVFTSTRPLPWRHSPFQ